ncbi:hypothetical protein EV356DRAFT_500468 [Viridothelium virens]|uniref:Uncharacterized protein n=1 Tax=Viridothelium virens TaxID=1048519 RepID=A0A6A6HB31_VIRVR|nr:hypothetical protein EV356DRAFT_500468 [Viridothelium virens]
MLPSRQIARCLLPNRLRLATLSLPRQRLSPAPLFPRQAPYASHVSPLARHFAAASSADEQIDEIQELYATARDEFEIAAEETEKMTVYAEDDRKAAREELTKLQEAYKKAIEGPDPEVGEEIKRRIGQRIRELENAVVAMEETAQNQD